MTEAALRTFTFDGEDWVAWVSGSGAYGTGVPGLGNVEAVHFARATESTVPVFEALVAAGRLEGLFDDELRELFRGARRVVDASELPESVRTKGRTRSLRDHGQAPETREPGYE